MSRSYEIDPYWVEANRGLGVSGRPESWTLQDLVPLLRGDIAGAKDRSGSAITLKHTPPSDFPEKEDYQVTLWPELLQSALDELNPAHPKSLVIRQALGKAMRNVVAALTINSSEGIEVAAELGGWKRFLQGAHRWAGRSTDQRREYIVGGQKDELLVGAHIAFAPCDVCEAIARISFGEMIMDDQGNIILKTGAKLEQEFQPAGTYSGSFVAKGKERTWTGRWGYGQD